MMLHAEGDEIIWIELGRKLLKLAKDSGKTNIEFHSFNSSYENDHNDIFTSDKLPTLVGAFYEKL